MPCFKFLGQVTQYTQTNDRIRRKNTQEKKSFGNSQSEMKMDGHWLDASRTLLQMHRSLIGGKKQRPLSKGKPSRGQAVLSCGQTNSPHCIQIQLWRRQWLLCQMRFREQHLDAILKEKLLLKVELLWGLKSEMRILKPCENRIQLPFPAGDSSGI